MKPLLATLAIVVALLSSTAVASARPAPADPASTDAGQRVAAVASAPHTIVFDASKANAGQAPAAQVARSGLGSIDTTSDTGIATLAVIAIGIGALTAGLGAGFMTARHPVHFHRQHLG